MFLALMLAGYTAAKFVREKTSAGLRSVTARSGPQVQQKNGPEPYPDCALGAEAWVAVPVEARRTVSL